jgi:hypothetical protein
MDGHLMTSDAGRPQRRSNDEPHAIAGAVLEDPSL